MAILSFKRCTVHQFQGINREAPIILEFPKPSAKSSKRKIAYVTGDYGRGKTSLINFILYATGQAFDFKMSNLVNNDTGRIQAEFEFVNNDVAWKVKCTKTKFELFRLFKAGGEEGWIPQGEADAVLKRLIGNVALSPMKLKTDKGEQQVDWLFKMLNVPADVLKKGQEITEKYNKMVTARADANRNYEFLKKALNEDPMYINWESSQKKYAEKKSIDTERQRFDLATQNKERFQRWEDFRTTVVVDIQKKKDEIAELEKKVAQAKAEEAQLLAKQQEAIRMVEKNKAVKSEYEKAHTDYMTLSQYLAEQKQWEKIKQQKKDMEGFETLVQNADTSKGQLKKARRDLYNKILPNIPGLEIVTADEIDGDKTGIYLNGKTPIQLSESELLDLYFQFCEALNVSVAVVENIGNFGSNVYETLNAMSKRGVQIWATQTVRGQKELKIEFIDKL